MLAQPFEADDRRSSPRIPHRGEVLVQVGSDSFPARLVDVAANGLGLLTSRPPPGGFLRVRFRVTDESGWLDVDGIVVRSFRRGRDVFWGVKLHGVNPGTRVRLRDYVRRSGD